MTYVIRPDDRAAFKRCRRAWDFASPARRNFEPADCSPTTDMDRGLRDALAVYYFPGMWEWDRTIVRPLAIDGFARSFHEQRSAGQSTVAPSDESSPDRQEQFRRGKELLEHYFAWAPAEDDFVPVRVETDFSVPVPDPSHPERDLTTPAGEPIHYEGRIDMLVVDPYDNYWMVEHRTVSDRWTDLDQLLLDERGTSFCWAWELFYLGMKISGVIYDELAVGEPGTEMRSIEVEQPRRDRGPRHRRMYARGGRDPGPVISRKESPFVRRTRIRRRPGELEKSREQMAHEALDMSSRDTRIYPSPSPSNCGECAYRQPCIAVGTGVAIEEAMSDYRQRTPEELQEGRLGGVTWSMGRGAAPPKFGRPRNQ